MALNPSIILSGQPLDVVGSMDRGATAGARMNDIQHTRRYRNALDQYGAGAIQGDQNALAQLARFDPAASQNLQTGQLNMDLARRAEARNAQMHPLAMQQAGLNIQATQQNMEMARQAAANDAAQAAANMSIAEREASQEALTRAVTSMGAAQTPEQWDQYATELGLTDYVGRFADRDFLVARATGTLEGLGGQADDTPASFRSLEMRAQAAGLVPGSPEYARFMMDGGREQDGLLIETNPTTGALTVRQGSGIDQERPPEATPSSPEAVMATIDGILNDPELEQGLGVRGVINGYLGALAPNARRIEGRLNQLDGQAFLQAFESLKGGGQITEIEGQKATEAMGRLNRAQSVADYRDALKELRGIMALAISRPRGWTASQQGQTPQAPTPQPTTGLIPEADMQKMSTEELQAIIDAGSN